MKMKRLLTLLVATVMLVTSCFALEAGSAVAEGFAAGETFSNVDFSEEGFAMEPDEMRDGNWIYKTNASGYATLTGFADPGVNSLTIPASIGGKSVTSVASGAFVNLSSLRTITIPGTVTTIGKDAFANPTQVTVKGYHGSAALRYASSNGMGVTNLSVHNFKSGVVDMTGSQKYISRVSSGVLSMRPVDAARLSVGTTFLVPGKDKYGMNLIAGTVTAMNKEGDQVLVSFDGKIPFEVMNGVDINAAANDVYYEISSLGEGVTYEDEVGAAKKITLIEGKDRDTGEIKIATKTFDIAKALGLSNATAKLSLDISARFKFNMEAAIDIGWTYFDPYVKLNKCDFTLTATPTFNFSFTQKLSSGKKKIGSITIYTDGVFYISADIYLTVDASGKVTITLQQQYQLSITWNKSAKSFNSPSFTKATLKKEISLEATLTVSFRPAVVIKVIGVEVLNMTLSIPVELYAKLTIRNASPLYTCTDIAVSILPLYLDLWVGIRDKIDLFDKLVEYKLYAKTWNNLTSKNTLFSMHLEDFKVVDKCTRGSKTVNFNPNGGSMSATSLSAAWYTKIYVNDPKRDHYKFTGWYKESGLKNKFDLAKDFVISDMTLYAGWTPDQYQVSFNTNGGTAAAAKKVEYNKTVSLPTTTKKGYTFDGWYSDSKLTKSWSSTTKVTKPVTLYAKWKINKYNVSFNSNGGSSVATQQVEYNKTASLPSPTRTGYTFAGWYSDSALKNAWTASTKVTGAVTLYAKWNVNKYTVTFDSNGGNSVPSQQVEYGKKVTLPVPTKTGYYFAGWYSDKNLTKAWTSTTKVTQNVTLYASWSSSSSVTPTPEPETTETPTPTPVITPTPEPGTTPEVTADPSVTPGQAVSSLILNKTGITLWANTENNSETLIATVLPENAENKNLIWSSSDESVASVDGNGTVQGLSAGIAVITCKSDENDTISSTCQVQVISAVTEISLDSLAANVLKGDTLNLTAVCLPQDASAGIIWSTTDESIAVVDQTGRVTAVGHGTAFITATAADGFGAKATCSVVVENVLELNAIHQNEVFYRSGRQEDHIGYVSLTNGSMLRMQRLGATIHWNLTASGDGASEANIVEYPLSAVVDGENVESNAIMLDLVSMKNTGTDTYTVTCTAGEYTATETFRVNVVGSENEYATKVTLQNTTFNVGIGETVQIPSVPVIVSGQKLPEGLRLSTGGADQLYYLNAVEEENENGLTIRFTDSGLYTANAVYDAANITYEVPLTFYVHDSNGQVHLPVSRVSLDASSYQVVVGRSVTAKANILPEDAYNKNVLWSVEDPDVAQVDANGVISGIKAGTTTLFAVAADGSGISAAAMVSVEDYLQMYDDVIDVEVYLDGNTNVWITGCQLTYDSMQRLTQDGLTPIWKLEKLSGNHVEIALDETESSELNGLEGIKIWLLRMNSDGTDSYRLTCTAGQYSASCIVRIAVNARDLPESVSIGQPSYETVVNSILPIDLTPVCAVSLPDETQTVISGSQLFWSNVAYEDRDGYHVSYAFASAGVYPLTVRYEGSNYSFEVPLNINVYREDGTIPILVESIDLSKGQLEMLVGESEQLTATVIPEDATDNDLTWSSLDQNVVTVDGNGFVTAVGAGSSGIIVANAASGASSVCLVTVENGLTFENSETEMTVYVDGSTRKEIGRIFLTGASSRRIQNDSPEWSLKRVSGNNLTLRVSATESAVDEDEVIYGAAIQLYSVSRAGDTVYDLTCTVGNESTTSRLTVHAVESSLTLPSAVTFRNNTFSGKVGELITVSPEIVCMPEDRTLPPRTKLSVQGSARYQAALNASECFVNRVASTFSFNAAGVYEADFVYSWMNISYTIPVTFRIAAADNTVPVLANTMTLNRTSLWLVPGDSFNLEAIFTPAGADNCQVSWESTSPSVVTVDQNGKVTAVGNGVAEIVCTAADSWFTPKICTVTVEDYLTVETGADELTLYKQGKATNALSHAWLSEGTKQRLEKDGISPKWSLERISGNHSMLVSTLSDGDTVFNVHTASLDAGGKDTYRISCKAGDRTWSQVYTLNIIDLGCQAPTKVMPATRQVSAAVGQTVTIDFTPVCEPSSATIPDGMSDYYVGIGEFYNALDHNVYSENGNRVTVAFTKPGNYILTRQYFLNNITYISTCSISVGNTEPGYSLLVVEDPEPIVYTNAKAGDLTTVSLNDAVVYESWSDLKWTLERVSGASVTVALKGNGNAVTLYAADVEGIGTDVWRVNCSFGDLTESVDITVTAEEARKQVPTSVELYVDHLSGMIGNWISLPLGVKCEPASAALPRSGDTYWHFDPLGMASDVCESNITGGVLKLRFTQSGYYSGNVVYSAGNVKYTMPVWFTVTDEEEVVPSPELSLFMTNSSTVVYQSGKAGASIGTAVVTESLNDYYAGSSQAYMKDHPGTWKVTVLSGTAATLEMKPVAPDKADVLLKTINGTGKVSYKVECTSAGKTYSWTGDVTVTDDADAIPDPTLMHSIYYIGVGKSVLINKHVYERSSGLQLQSTATWNVDAVLSAIGYDYTTEQEGWSATFYKEGTFNTSVSVQVGNMGYDLPVTIVVSSEENPEETVTVLKLPSALREIEEEAFMGIQTNVVDLRSTKVKSIGNGAFKACIDLKKAYIPDSVDSIGENAFYGCLNVTIICSEGSTADNYAKSHNIPVEYQ